MTAKPSLPKGLILRSDWRPGDLGRIVEMHGRLYSAEYGFNATFEAYVAGPLSEFVLHAGPRERIWLAEVEGTLAGCIAIVECNDVEAQLRWFVVSPEFRGAGLGRHLISAAIEFCRNSSYRRIMLWTVGELQSAARLYERSGFRLKESSTRHLWGADRVEQRYEMELDRL